MARLCSICKKPMAQGWYCCDEYYCSEACLLKGTGEKSLADWEAKHYTDDGDCYWTEWDDLGDRDTLETAALLAVSAADYYQLADNIEITTDEELREIIRKNRSIKYYYEQQNIGRAKYVINYYDGFKKNRDGSQALDCAIFGSKIKRDLFTKELRDKGFVQRGGLCL